MTEALARTEDIQASEYAVAIKDSSICVGSVPDKAKGKKIELSWSFYDSGKRYRILAAIQKDKGGYISYCLSLPGAVSCGDTVEEAIENLREAVVGCILSYRDAGQEIPWTDASGSKDEYDFTQWIAVDV